MDIFLKSNSLRQSRRALTAKPASVCAACNANLYEGRSAIYDSLFEVYACGTSCWSEWYAENEAEYKRRWTGAVDL